MTHLVWDFPKEIFKIGSFAPRWYGLMFATGFMVGYSYMQSMFKKENRNIEDLSSLLYYVMFGTIIGARLGHCLFYAPEIYLSNPISILYIWEGGLASHGGTIGVFLALWLYQRQHLDQSYLWLADRLSIAVAFTGACIRIGNFFNSEILGKPSDLPWAIIFADNKDNIARHPAMLYESLSYLILFGVLLLIYKKTAGKNPGQMIGLLLVWIFTSRFFIEFVKENQVSFENDLPINMGQILSIPFIILGLVTLTGKIRLWMPWLDAVKKLPKKAPFQAKGKLR